MSCPDPGVQLLSVLSARLEIFSREMVVLVPTAVLGLAWRPPLDWTELLGQNSAAFLLENQQDWSQFYAVEMDWLGPVPARKVARTEDPCLPSRTVSAPALLPSLVWLSCCTET